MVGHYFRQRQKNIFSAAFIIMIMVSISRILGLLRNRVLAHFFSAEEISLYLAAFRLPEVVFDVLVFGAISAAFIPTFTAYFTKKKEDEAWQVASITLNSALLLFFFFSSLIFLFANPLYRLTAAGFRPDQINKIVFLSRILILTQIFFLLSYFLTGILESLQRFLVPAIAPIFYNLSIILGTIIFSNKFGLLGPTIGAVTGALVHFLIQLPLSFSLGLKIKLGLNFSHPGFKEIVKLAFPRIIELSVLELSKNIELFLASLISPAAYTWLTFASSLQLLPVALFGTSLAKATLPTLASLATKKDIEKFKKTFLSSFNQILFLTIPASSFLAVLRIPAVRLVFGAARFTWESTVQTGQTLSVFCLSIFSQALILLLARAFYALHKTKTAVKISVATISFNISLAFILILVLHLPIWGLALSFSVSSLIHLLILFFLLDREVGGFRKDKIFLPFAKVSFSAFLSSLSMFVLLKIFDRSAWDKRLSFLGKLGLRLPTTFEGFVLDTRYTLNLIVLTLCVAFVGVVSYLFLTWILKVDEFVGFKKFKLNEKNSNKLIRNRPFPEKEDLTEE
jgi:putative peptidoglycan lipid II flippase